MIPAAFQGLELLAAAVILLDHDLLMIYANPAAENLFELSTRSMTRRSLSDIFANAGTLTTAVNYALVNSCSYIEHDLRLAAIGRTELQLSCAVTPLETRDARVLLEFRQMDKQLKIAKEERMLDQQQANRELLLNLAHEIKNPLGGIRGAAQLLERELERPGLFEYTQVIIKEADRLQTLMDRLLAPHRLPQLAEVNIHEVLEQVKTLLLAEFPQGIEIERDYDSSLPTLTGDREDLTQATLNIMRNAAQALEGKGKITLRTRVVRQITLAKKRYRHALMVQISDNGPGVPEAIRERIFYPLVSGREGGSGMGLTIAQTFINQHRGIIDCESRPGRTCFTLLLPLAEDSPAHTEPG
ncbi:MAG TPA: nitrogen regulation protein NR(II) [Burkholderiales bacterium]|nr:nitrogen regulation protein NR(II) [Burkholderiales bacterium]